MNYMSEVKKFMRFDAVSETVGLKRSAIYSRIREKTFPAPIKLGPQVSVWDSTEIAKWQEKCITDAAAATGSAAKR